MRIGAGPRSATPSRPTWSRSSPSTTVWSYAGGGTGEGGMREARSTGQTQSRCDTPSLTTPHGPGRTAGERRPPPSLRSLPISASIDQRNPGCSALPHLQSDTPVSVAAIQARRLSEVASTHFVPSTRRHRLPIGREQNHRRSSSPFSRELMVQVGQLTQQSNVTRPQVAAHQTSGRSVDA